METTEKKWYQKPVWIYVLCFVFFPVGLYLLWKNQEITKRTKYIITGAVVLFVLLFSKDTDNSSFHKSSSSSDCKKKCMCAYYKEQSGIQAITQKIMCIDDCKQMPGGRILYRLDKVE